ncbi:MAG TPA: sugar ABC transporter permease [Trueperaceae bacterium]|nr:sugar ABC transporter permease [Trueperaceae bacterium]
MIKRDRIFVIATILPALAVIGFIILYPLARSLSYSLTNYNLIHRTNSFVGLQNFTLLFTDPTFYRALENTLLICIAPVVGAFLIGFAQALVLDQAIVARNFFRGLALVPWVIPQIVVAFLFNFMYNPSVGVVNVILKDLGLIHRYVPWLAHPGSAPVAVILAYIWNETPFFMLMLLAGLQSIPGDIVEAAVVDGASGLGVFRYITVPGLRRIIAISTILMVIWNFNNFTIIWPMTQGGPINATLTFVVYVYRNAFQNFNIGYAATVGVVWLVLLLILTFFYMRAVSGDEEPA